MFDVAGRIGIPYHTNDMGITFATYGIDEGPYLVAPVLGPTNPRDMVGKVGDSFLDPVTYVAGNNDWWYVPLSRTVVSGIDVRSRNIEALADIEKTSLDFYATIRSLFRQRRAAEIRHENSNLPNPTHIAEQRGRAQPGGFAVLRQPVHLQGVFRQMIGRRAAIALLAFGLLGLAAPRQATAQDPSDFVNSLGEQAIQVLAPDVSAAQRLSRFRALLSSQFDVSGIGRFVLGRYWRTATPQEQQEFLALFQEYVARAYSARLGGFGGEPFRVTGAHPGGAETVVNSEIVLASGPIGIDWYLANEGGRYKITDVYIAGISMKVTQRDEFAAVIQRSGGRVDGLLSQLRQKLADELILIRRRISWRAGAAAGSTRR